MRQLRFLLFILSITFSSNVVAQSVYTTKTGEKYHKSSCSYLKYSKYKMELKKAIDFGYEACSRCKPTRKLEQSNANSLTNSDSENAKPESPKGSSKKSIASQCTGKTKAGKRCKRRTKNASGRCYQH